jgi:hypothetical protein
MPSIVNNIECNKRRTATVSTYRLMYDLEKLLPAGWGDEAIMEMQFFSAAH